MFVNDKDLFDSDEANVAILMLEGHGLPRVRDITTVCLDPELYNGFLILLSLDPIGAGHDEEAVEFMLLTKRDLTHTGHLVERIEEGAR